MESKKVQNGKKIVPRGDPILHGNHARIDPHKDIVSEYEFSSVVQKNLPEAKANLPVSSAETVEMAKNEVDANHK